MQIAYYMGFSKVFLIGVDHNFKVIGNPNEKQFLVGEDLNHFDPKYFRSKEWHLPDLEASELGYHLAKFYFNKVDDKSMIPLSMVNCKFFQKFHLNKL